MIKAVRDIKSTVATCAGMKADVATLEAWITTVLDQPSIPDFIVAQIKSNKLKLTRDLAKAKLYWGNEKYFAFGEILGEMLVIVTTP